MGDAIWFDTHLHLDATDVPRALLEPARQVGVGYFLVAGTDAEDSRRAIAVARAEPGVVASVGVHPHAAGQAGNLAEFRELLAAPQAVAVGEIGLDYYYDHSPRADQRRVFAAFLELAGEFKRPVIVHCRDAFDDCLPMLAAAATAGLRVLIHSFTGTPAQAEQALGFGALLSFNGMVTFPKADNIRAALAVVPTDRLLLETDSPYLAPVPQRGKRNVPAYLVAVGERVATEKHLSTTDLARLTTGNALRFFGMVLLAAPNAAATAPNDTLA
jgi:TatD DNase family protein